jgi:hypothetical protein
MSFFSKYIGGSFLPLVFAQMQNKKSQIENECNVDAQAMQDEEALQKIFEDGG